MKGVFLRDGTSIFEKIIFSRGMKNVHRDGTLNIRNVVIFFLSEVRTLVI